LILLFLRLYGIRQISFGVTLDSTKAKHIKANSHVSVYIFDDNCEGSSNDNITFEGDIEVATDIETKRKYCIRN